jgi:hypothetical protein
MTYYTDMNTDNTEIIKAYFFFLKKERKLETTILTGSKYE